MEVIVKLGLIGLGKMGGNMAERLRRFGHEVVGYDTDPALSEVASVEELVAQLDAPRIVWVMVPDFVTDQVIDQVAAQIDRKSVV